MFLFLYSLVSNPKEPYIKNMKTQPNLNIIRYAKELKPRPQSAAFWKKDINPVSKKKKTRRVCAPNSTMSALHGILRRRLRAKCKDLKSATGCRKGDSSFATVLRHRSKVGENLVFNRHFVLLDIKGAYHAVDLYELATILAKVDRQQFSGYKNTVEFLERYCSDPQLGGLAVGAPSSQDLFNLYCEYRIDAALRVVCQKYKITYTRYIDDLTFSSQQQITKRMRQEIRLIITEAGFVISEKKAEVLDLKKGPITVNGVGITYAGRTFLPRHILRTINGLIHCALNGDTVNISRIHGLMGLFKQLTDLTNPNSTEQKIIEGYEELQRRIHSFDLDVL